MANIDDFKANLIGGGARANQFRVTITPPPGIAIGLDVRRASFLCTAAQLPTFTLGEEIRKGCGGGYRLWFFQNLHKTQA